MKKGKPLTKRMADVLWHLEDEGAIVLSLRQSINSDETKAFYYLKSLMPAPKKTVEKMIKEGLLVANHTDLFGHTDLSQTFVAGGTDELC